MLRKTEGDHRDEIPKTLAKAIIFFLYLVTFFCLSLFAAMALTDVADQRLEKLYSLILFILGFSSGYTGAMMQFYYGSSASEGKK